jgi:dTDP-4-dehydrorhamnose reductase
MTARVLITGGTGLLGLNWAANIKNTHDVVLGIHQRAVHLPGIATQQLSLESVDSFLENLDLIQPDYVIHAAGLASVDLCEEKLDLAYHVNVDLAENVARACALRGIQLAHISTDHLFCGDRAFLDEEATVDPINIYGKTKAEAEMRVQDVYPEALVIRTNFYGWGPRYRQSFSDWVLNNLKTGHPITLFNDVFYTPIYIGRLVQIVHQLFEGFAKGTFHVVGDERVSKYDFAMQLASTFGLDKNLISAGSVRSQTNLVVRPQDMSLSNKKVSKELNIHVGGIKEHLLLMKQSRFPELETI